MNITPTIEMTGANAPIAQSPAPEASVSDAARAEALIKSLEADLDFIIYKSNDPRAHEIACAAKRKITAHRVKPN